MWLCGYKHKTITKNNKHHIIISCLNIYGGVEKANYETIYIVTLHSAMICCSSVKCSSNGSLGLHLRSAMWRVFVLKKIHSF